MIFSQADFDLLRLLRWNRHLLPETIDGLFHRAGYSKPDGPGADQDTPEKRFLCSDVKKGTNCSTTRFPSQPPTRRPSYRPVRNAAAAPPVHAGGDSIPRAYPHLYHCTGGIILQSFSFSYGSLRGRGHNPWGNTRVAALAHLGGLLLDVHYVCSGIGKLCLADELTVFNNQAARFRELQEQFSSSVNAMPMCSLSLRTGISHRTINSSTMPQPTAPSVFRCICSPVTALAPCSFKSCPSRTTGRG